ncbi:hypothetical protein ACHAW5_003308 [Stephanodiscus triporus]|uniref:Uncharacterized protein n=1 Tax=Stephanodiscus triporus TaxID=2934178 RepID=A0ABD3QB44_9STRA
MGSVVGGMMERRDDTLVGGEGGSGLVIPVASVSDQSSFVTDIDDGLLFISLPSRELSDLNYDSLQHDGKTSLAEGFTAIDPGSSPMPHAGGSLSDSIKGQLDRLNLPHYHIELPTMTNPFLELSPSLRSTLSSIKTASGATEEKLGGVFNTITRSFEDLNNRVADVAHSFDGLSGPMAAERGEVAVAAASVQSSFVTDIDDGRSISLPSQRLSDLNYDNLQHDGKTSLAEGFTAIDPGSSPMPHAGGSLSDSIKGQLDRLNLPHYHIELPTMTNPFLELSPSLQSALSSIKTASGSTEEKLGGVFNTITRSFEDMSDRVADVAHSFEGLSGQMAEVGSADASGMKSLVNSLQGGASKGVAFRRPNFNVEVNDFDAPNSPQLHMHLPTLPNLNIFDGTSDTLRRIGDASLSDFGNSVLSTFKFTGGIVVKFLDFIKNSISGTSVASSIAHAQYSVTTAIENASHAVVGALTKIGNMTIIEIVQDIMKLVIVITDILLKIMNAILYVISGKDGAAWATKATSSIEVASSQLLAQATSTYEDFTHTSLAELAHSIGDYGHYVGGEFSTLVAALRGDVDGVSVVAVSLPDDILDSLASALQTTMSL